MRRKSRKEVEVLGFGAGRCKRINKIISMRGMMGGGALCVYVFVLWSLGNK